MIKDQIVSNIQRFFNEKRIISLLFFGTRAFNVNINPNSDYDFMLILDKYNASDIFQLRKITTKKTNLLAGVTINFLYLTDILKRGKINFQQRSVLADFYVYLRDAKILLGKNIFKDDPLFLEEQQLKKILDFKIQECYGRCDKILLQNSSDESVYPQIQKYTREMIRGLLIRQKYIEISDIPNLRYSEMFQVITKKKLFFKKTADNFRLLLDYEYSPIKFKKVDHIRRLIYEKYLKIFSS